jgi:hypothetical protein
MANLIIQSEERAARENEILRMCGKSLGNSTSEHREMAALISEKTYEEIKKMEAKDYDCR